ncbi:hypothetical protein PG996_013612 [Apiospora saccharicola]|uniref:Uncharacterized protein n=1 Tax=Apiospora saccharicola TaxID=335842 RepID=A0ABR1U5X3_9PEZI
MSRLRSNRTVSRDLSMGDGVTPASGVAGAVMALGGDVPGMGAITPMGAELLPFLEGFLIGARALEEVTVGSAEVEVEGLRGGAATLVVLSSLALGRLAVLLLFSSDGGGGLDEEDEDLEDRDGRDDSDGSDSSPGSDVAEEAAEEAADDRSDDVD